MKVDDVFTAESDTGTPFANWLIYKSQTGAHERTERGEIVVQKAFIPGNFSAKH